MKAHQLVSAISSDLQHEIMNYLHTAHPQAYDMVLNTLAQFRKFRPIFVQRKAPADQYKWLIEQMRLRTSEELASQVLQLWLLKGQPDMLKTFLDEVGIEHKDGEVENLPEEISKEKAAKAITALLEKFSGERVAIYMAMFQKQRDGGWAGLTEAVEAEPKLKLAA